MSATTRQTETVSGGITIKHHDAVLASSERALRVHGEGEAPVYYLPKESVYFEQMTEHGAGELAGGQRVHFWSVVASGGGVDRAAWVVEGAGELAGYVGFDTNKVSIEGA